VSSPPRAQHWQAVETRASAVWLWPAGAVAAGLIVQVAFVRASWFLLDDIRNLAEARQQGLTWHFLTTPIGEHFTPGHRFLDWMAAVPLGGHWAGAVSLMLAFSGIALVYLAGSLALLFGTHRRNAIPVLLAGTAWPLLGTAQWFAGAALAIPVAAAIAGALFHHLRWRLHGRGRDWAAAGAWTLVGLLFSEQAMLIPAFLFVCGLIARGGRPDWRSVAREVLAVLPLVAAALALALYVDAQPWAVAVSPPALTTAIQLVRVVVVRGLLPALAGIGMAGAPPDPSREVFMRALVTVGAILALAAAVWLRRRLPAALVLAGCGTILTAVPIALARLSVGVSMAGSEPRYLLPAVLFDSLAIGALLAPQHDRAPRSVPAGSVWLAAGLGLAWVLVYIANLHYTYDARRFALDSGTASRQMALRLERGLRIAIRAGDANEMVDGPLPSPLFYPGSANVLSAYARFFVSQPVTAPGVPGHSGLLSIAPNGAIQRVAFQPTGQFVRCADSRACSVPVDVLPPQNVDPALWVQLRRPARIGESVHYHVSGPLDEAPDRKLPIPVGATRFVIPAVLADPRSIVVTFQQHPIEIGSARSGLLQPCGSEPLRECGTDRRLTRATDG